MNNEPERVLDAYQPCGLARIALHTTFTRMSASEILLAYGAHWFARVGESSVIDCDGSERSRD